MRDLIQASGWVIHPYSQRASANIAQAGPEQEQLSELEPAVEAELAEPAQQDAPAAETAPIAAPTSTAPTDRLSASTSLEGSARSQLNPDGSLLKPKAPGPLAGLRQKLAT